MRRLTAVGVLFILALSGCGAMRERRWGACAVGGGVVGALIGGGTGAGLAAAYEKRGPTDKDDGEVVGIGLGSAAGGALLGTLLGHMICDPIDEPPPPPPVAAPPPPPPPAKGVKLATVGEAYFDFDKADLKPSVKDVLAGTVKTLNDNPSVRVVVEGHADSIGSEAYNQRLSERRAAAVKNYLVREGIDSSRISTQGYGEAKPVASNMNAEGRSQNRRAEVIAD